MRNNIQEFLDIALSSEAEQEKTEHGPKKSWWFSDMGKCLSGVYYARLGKEGKPKDGRSLRVFKIGNIFEDFLLESLTKRLKKLERPETIYLKEFDISGRPDGIATYEDDFQEVLEVKTVHSDKFWWMVKKNEGPDEHYLQQLWWGMKATGIPNGRLVYLSKDDLCIQEYTLSIDDEYISTKCLKEIGILNEAWKTKIPPEPVQMIVQRGKKQVINWLAKYCDYHQFCTGNDHWLEQAEQRV